MVTAIYAAGAALLYAGKKLFGKSAAPAMTVPAPVGYGNVFTPGNLWALAALLFSFYFVLRGIKPLLK